MNLNKFKIFLVTILFFYYRNSFALDCLENSTKQRDMTECAEKELDEQEKKLNILYNTYLKFLGGKDYLEAKNFKKSHVAWINYRDLYCKYATTSCEGGTVCGLVLATCLTTKTKQRLEEIEGDFDYKKQL